MKPLSKGAPVKVRLHTGEVVEAVYKEYDEDWGMHYLDLNGYEIIAPNRETNNDWECRFIGSPCVLVPVGVSL